MLFFVRAMSGSVGRNPMRSIKIFNNNAVSTVMPDGREAIVLGNGIGFHKRPGDPVDEQRIEKVYYVQDEMQTRFLQLLQNVRPEVMEAAEEIMRMGAKAGLTMGNQGAISLIDHISFTVERFEQGIVLPNLMLSEIRMLYKKEYELGLRALDIIQKRCGVALPEDEAGYIALHLVTISVDRSSAYDTLKFVKGTLDIIKDTYGVTLDENSIDAMRLTTHLKFLAQRIFRHEDWKDDSMEDMYRYLLEQNPKNQECLDRLNDYISKTFHYTLNQQEKFYLLIHLTKVLQLGE
ncbi:MAG: PRD domain-containing protein [Clostridiales bacterium]|nr:PRD domain-containing protein [Clostridiales bacterium]